MLQQFLSNVAHNLFKPLLLFFYAGFLVPILGVSFEFPHVIYQGLTIFLLLAIGWHGGEELAHLRPDMLGQALGFMLIGFIMNCIIGVLAYRILRSTTTLRKVDAATVAGYYGSDSAGTFVTCMGVLAAANIAAAPYMPVMLAVMEIPGCLVALLIVAKLRQAGMDAEGNSPGEPGYRIQPLEKVTAKLAPKHGTHEGNGDEANEGGWSPEGNGSGSYQGAPLTLAMADGSSVAVAEAATGTLARVSEAIEREKVLSLQEEKVVAPVVHKPAPVFSKELLHEVFLNPGIFLLFAGIAVGFISGLQGEKVTAKYDELFLNLFQPLLCLFLLEMGMTASKRLRDLKTAGIGFIAFGLLAPNVFACLGMLAAHGYSMVLGQPFAVGTYVLFGVLCGSASYIALPAVQRMAIPEASPTLPLASSLGLTFSYNVTIGIPVYIMIATILTTSMPVTAM